MLPLDLYRAAQVREMDRIAIEECGVSGAMLMERAGAAAYEVIRKHWPAAGTITVICGGGNNGGDGYVIARLLKADGYSIRTLYTIPPEKLKGEAKQAADKLVSAGLEPEPYRADKLKNSDLIVDALLGTGLDREITGTMRSVIEGINASAIPVFAIDIPSGLHADNGQVQGVSIRAEATISFLGLKQGLFTGQGADYAGRIYFHDLGAPQQVYEKVAPAARRLALEDQRQLLKKRPRTAHKGHCGHVLIVGGDSGYAGAPRMAAEAAGRAGAGLVSVATRPQHAVIFTMARPEIMAHGIERVAQLSGLIEKANVIAIGPGLGQSEWSQMLLAKVLESRLPLVLDADALNLLASEPARQERWILTPHPGEAARLLNSTSAAVQSDRFAAIDELQKKYGGVIVLKGSGTLVADQAGHIAVCTAGNPGMATGGMGDVLTGVIAALVAQGYDPADAARLGVTVHATAADYAAQGGERGMLALDLMPWLRQLMNTD